MEQMNYGVKVELKPSDKVAGIFGIPYEIRLPSGDWTPWLAGKERQSPPETMSCVSFSCNHSIDTQINYLLDQNYFSKEAREYFNSAGYMASGSFNSSDRFLAISSHTTREGNGLQNVLDTARKVGLLPEVDLPFGGSTWEQYHNKAVITQAMKDKAVKILQYIDIQYEWVIIKDDGGDIRWTLVRHLKQAPIQLCIPVCSSFVNGSDPAGTCGLREPQHAIMAYKIDTVISVLDQYAPYTKHLALNYPILYGLKIVVTSKSLPILETKTVTTESGRISTTETPSYWQRFFSWLTREGIKYVVSGIKKVGSFIKK